MRCTITYMHADLLERSLAQLKCLFGFGKKGVPVVNILLLEVCTVLIVNNSMSHITNETLVTYETTVLL